MSGHCQYCNGMGAIPNTEDGRMITCTRCPGNVTREVHSCSCTIRTMCEWCQWYINKHHKEPYIPRACPCRSRRGYKHGWCGVAGGGVPGCEH